VGVSANSIGVVFSIGLFACALAGCNHASAPLDAAGPVDAAAGPRADGTLTDWQTLGPMPEKRANHCAVAAGGYLVVLGGNQATAGGGFQSLATVQAAPLEPDGTLGPWQLAGKTPSAVSECTATSDGSRIYLVDGIYDGATDGGKVWSADLDEHGRLGPWTALGPLPPGTRVLYSTAWVLGGALYAMDSKLPEEGDVTLTLRASLQGGLGPFVESDWLPGFRGHPEYAFARGFVYVLGGYVAADAGDVVIAEVQGAPLSQDGTVGAPETAEALPAPTAFGTVTVVDNYLFLVGGKSAIFAADGSALVASTEVEASGALGGFTAQAALPEGRTSHATVLAGDFLYVTGGGYDGPGLDTVYAARVRR
jgi:hypothetical protein